MDGITRCKRMLKHDEWRSDQYFSESYDVKTETNNGF